LLESTTVSTMIAITAAPHRDSAMIARRFAVVIRPTAPVGADAA
jgi:hypothetical protein